MIINFKATTEQLENQLIIIAKHCTALAEELAQARKEVCTECGSTHLETVGIYGDNEHHEIVECINCGHKKYRVV